MFQDIVEYMLNTKEYRQQHLMLNESCIEINTRSGHCRALLAHYLGTTVPQNRNLYLCHACNNGKCSNPRHLYWGTPSENIEDTYLTNRPFRSRTTCFNRMKEQLGEEKYNQLRLEIGRKAGKTLKKKNDLKWSPFKDKIQNSDINFSKYGWVNDVANILNIHPQKVCNWMKRYLPTFYEEKCFKRNGGIVKC